MPRRRAQCPRTDALTPGLCALPSPLVVSKLRPGRAPTARGGAWEDARGSRPGESWRSQCGTQAPRRVNLGFRIFPDPGGGGPMADGTLPDRRSPRRRILDAALVLV